MENRTLNKHLEKDSTKIDPITHLPVDVGKPYLGVLKEMICQYLNINRGIVFVYTDEKNKVIGSMTMLETVEHRLPRFFRETKIKREIKEFYKIRGFELKEFPYNTSETAVLGFDAIKKDEKYRVLVSCGEDPTYHTGLEGYVIHVD